MPADSLAANLAAQIRVHLGALSEIREACHGQHVAALDAAYFELGKATYRLEVALVQLEAGEEPGRVA